MPGYPVKVTRPSLCSKVFQSNEIRSFPSSDFSDFGFFLDEQNDDQPVYICKNRAKLRSYSTKACISISCIDFSDKNVSNT